MLFSATLLMALALASVAGDSSVGGPDPCPNAAMLCEKESSNSIYRCSANVQNSSPEYAPKLTWSVSKGKISGDRRSATITVDVRGVNYSAVVVKLKVHWKNVPKICDASLTEKIELGRRAH